MKLRNKKTGETGYLHTHRDYKTGVLKVAVLKDGVPFSEFKPYEPIYDYDSIAELNAEWEDYEEPSKTIWQIKDSGELQDFEEDVFSDGYIESSKSIGNYFETPEKAEKAIEKLKAWKRLKDKGFEFDYWEYEFSIVDKPAQTIVIKANAVDTNNKDLDLLFGGEG